MDGNELLALKNKISKGKEELASLKGEKKYLLTQLKEEFDCVNLQQAEKLLLRERAELAELEKEIERKLEELEEKYGQLD